MVYERSIFKRKDCDFCHQSFKRGLRMDLVVNQVVVKENGIQWSTDDDIEYFAFFCSKECMVAYVEQVCKEQK